MFKEFIRYVFIFFLLCGQTAKAMDLNNIGGNEDEQSPATITQRNVSNLPPIEEKNPLLISEVSAHLAASLASLRIPLLQEEQPIIPPIEEENPLSTSEVSAHIAASLASLRIPLLQEEQPIIPSTGEEVRCKPLIDNNVVNGDFLDIVEDLNTLNILSYQVGKKGDLVGLYKPLKGWSKLSTFEAKNGYIFKDNPAIISYNKSKNYLAAFHGSLGFPSACWITNASLFCCPSEDYPEEFYFGFKKKTLQLLKPLIIEIVKVIDSKVPKDKKNSLQFIMTGHSQGGALAQIAGYYLIKKFFPEHYKNIENYDNNIHNKLYGYYISSAPPGMPEGLDRVIGKDNAICLLTQYDLFSWFTRHKNHGHLSVVPLKDALYKGMKINCSSKLELVKRGQFRGLLSHKAIFSSNPKFYTAINCAASLHNASQKYDKTSTFDPGMLSVKTIEDAFEFGRTCNTSNSTSYEQIVMVCCSVLSIDYLEPFVDLVIEKIGVYQNKSIIIKIAYYGMRHLRWALFGHL